MSNKKLIINNRVLFIILEIYVIGIFVWDYTLVYQIALILLGLCTILMYKNTIIRVTPQIIASFLFLVYFVLHTFAGLAQNKNLAYEYISTLGINLIALICIIRIIDSESMIDSIMKVVVYTAVVMWIYVLITDRAHLFTGDFGAHVRKPFFGGSYSHNNLPMLASYALLFLSYFRMKNKPIKHTFIICSFLITCIVLSGARKALIFAIIGLIVYPILFSGKSEKLSVKIMKLVVIGVAVLIVFYILLNNSVLYSIVGKRFSGFASGFFGGEYGESSARTRAIMAQTALNAIKDNMWTGIGLNNFRTLAGSFNTWSHNNYLEIMVSGGVIPLLLYYSSIVYGFIKLIKYKTDPLAGVLITFLSYLAIHDFLSVSYNARVIGLMLGLISVFLLMKKTRERKPNIWREELGNQGVCNRISIM